MPPRQDPQDRVADRYIREPEGDEDYHPNEPADGPDGPERQDDEPAYQCKREQGEDERDHLTRTRRLSTRARGYRSRCRTTRYPASCAFAPVSAAPWFPPIRQPADILAEGGNEQTGQGYEKSRLGANLIKFVIVGKVF